MDAQLKPDGRSNGLAAVPMPADVAGVESLRSAVSHHLLYTVGKDSVAASKRDWLKRFARPIRDCSAGRGKPIPRIKFW